MPIFIRNTFTECNFNPLIDIIGEKFAEEYMYMYTHETQPDCDGRVETIYSYKHKTTRNYVHVTASGGFVEAYVYHSGWATHNTFQGCNESPTIGIIENAIAYYKEGEMLKKACNVGDYARELREQNINESCI